MPPAIEARGSSIVFAGTFNPAIFHPEWFVRKELLPASAAEAARDQILTSAELSAFTADWLSLQVTKTQAVLSTVDEARAVDLRDVAHSVVSVLSETPVDAVGINTDVHFRAESEEQWHALGDQFVPKDFWGPLFDDEIWRQRPDGQRVGTRTVTVEAWREEINGYVRVEAAPSVRITPNGVYVGINGHFQLSNGPAERSNGYAAAAALDEHWESTQAVESQLIDRILSSVRK